MERESCGAGPQAAAGDCKAESRERVLSWLAAAQNKAWLRERLASPFAFRVTWQGGIVGALGHRVLERAVLTCRQAGHRLVLKGGLGAQLHARDSLRRLLSLSSSGDGAQTCDLLARELRKLQLLDVDTDADFRVLPVISSEAATQPLKSLASVVAEIANEMSADRLVCVPGNHLDRVAERLRLHIRTGPGSLRVSLAWNTGHMLNGRRGGEGAAQLPARSLEQFLVTDDRLLPFASSTTTGCLGRGDEQDFQVSRLTFQVAIGPQQSPSPRWNGPVVHLAIPIMDLVEEVPAKKEGPPSQRERRLPPVRIPGVSAELDQMQTLMADLERMLFQEWGRPLADWSTIGKAPTRFFRLGGLAVLELLEHDLDAVELRLVETGLEAVSKAAADAQFGSEISGSCWAPNEMHLADKLPSLPRGSRLEAFLRRVDMEVAAAISCDYLAVAREAGDFFGCLATAARRMGRCAGLLALAAEQRVGLRSGGPLRPGGVAACELCPDTIPAGTEKPSRPCSEGPPAG